MKLTPKQIEDNLTEEQWELWERIQIDAEIGLVTVDSALEVTNALESLADANIEIKALWVEVRELRAELVREGQ